MRRRAAAPRRGLPPVGRALLVAGSVVHIAYGIGSLLTPEKMVSAQYAPDTHDLDDPRLLLRAFGGHLLVSGALALATVVRYPRYARAAAGLCFLTNTFDMSSAVLEFRARGQSDASVNGGIALSGAGALNFAAALVALSR